MAQEQEDVEKLRAAIRDVPDFPKPGIIFKDITPLLRDAALFKKTLDVLTARAHGRRFDKVVAIESRGFIFGAALADRMGKGFVPVRKPGKLPSATHAATYDLEYGSSVVEMHKDAIAAGERVLLLDDVIATGGTAQAAAELVGKAGGAVDAFLFLIELSFLSGRERLRGNEVMSVVLY